jgi:hypothetical protein
MMQGQKVGDLVKAQKDCHLSDWGTWNQPKKCGEVTLSRSRSIVGITVTKIDNGGNKHVHTVGLWDVAYDYLQENRKMGLGFGNETQDEELLRTVKELKAALCKGTTDQSRKQCRKCDCKMTPWTDWSRCTKSCNYGVQIRRRKVVTSAFCGGVCKHTEEKRSCKEHDCCYRTSCQTNPLQPNSKTPMVHVKGLEPVWISKIHKVPRKYHRCAVGMYVQGRCDCSCELPIHLKRAKTKKDAKQRVSAADSDFAAAKFTDRLLQLSEGGLTHSAWLPSG